LLVNGKGTTVVNSCCYATTTMGTVDFFMVSSRGNNVMDLVLEEVISISYLDQF
jgi:hypothetical protein